MTDECAVGDAVDIQVGGKIFFDPDADASPALVLLAGGVGINALLPMAAVASQVPGRHVTLAYSAKAEERLFSNELAQMAETVVDGSELRVLERDSDRAGRLTRDDVQSLLGQHKRDARSMRAVVCGPPLFTDAMLQFLKDLDVERCEADRWW